MNPVTIISKKRDGQQLDPREIRQFVQGYTAGDIPDYQMAALAMAIFFQGMDSDETTELTRQMLHSGATLNWNDATAPKVDKHSTGGVGDKVSLILAPLLAACGLQVPMLSGRGLGPTGGTLDKLEAIPGLRTDLGTHDFQSITERVGCAIVGASAEVAPADRKLYALRDVTATVRSIPLITASILSKKLAEGLDGLVLDVKCGSGAFMKSMDEARRLATSLVSVGRSLNLQTTALVTDMSQPLGTKIGNALEVDEAILTLQGQGPADLMNVTLELGAELLLLAGRNRSLIETRQQLEKAITAGTAYEKFAQMVSAQEGDLKAPRKVAPCQELRARKTGYLYSLNTEALGWAVIELGGGRKFKTDRIDHSVGLQMLARVGDPVSTRQPLMNIYASQSKADDIRPLLDEAIKISDTPPTPPELVHDRITGS
jgi:pyrimidine-nucleoside phosphorylase